MTVSSGANPHRSAPALCVRASTGDCSPEPIDSLVTAEAHALSQYSPHGAWSGTPIRDTSCCCHPLTGVPYLRPGPRRRPAHIGPTGLRAPGAFPPIKTNPTEWGRKQCGTWPALLPGGISPLQPT